MFKRALQVTAVYALIFFGCFADWIWGSALPPLVGWIVFAAAFPISTAWFVWAYAPERRGKLQFWLSVTCVYVVCWPASIFIAHGIGREALRASLARIGLGGLFLIGLVWTVWALEKASQYYRKQGRLAAAEKDDSDSTRKLIWNPLDLEAWFYSLSPKRWSSWFHSPLNEKYWQHGARSRKLDQSFVGLLSYTSAFVLACLILSSLRGCSEVFDLPAGGGEQETVAQVVRVQKIIRKKYIVNPFSAISFNIPPIDEVKLQLTEITKHAYTIGYGEGDGAGFAGGTQKGKVQFIRLQYAGGDWDQDHGIGGDMNMLFEYGLRTNQRVNSRTESRTIFQVKNFKKEASVPFVFITGQQSISVSNTEVKILREYINDKHGMIFGDNGGSQLFHSQFLAMMRKVEPEITPVPIPLDDLIHRTPFQIPFLPYVAPHGGKEALGWWKDGRWVCYYHPGDIGDAWSDGHAGVDREIWEACYMLGCNVINYSYTEHSKWRESQKADN
ncbi:MAG: hypothetical protein ACI9G1_003376 [Pirellulaceae bacterium]|jgi:hypothetical protein